MILSFFRLTIILVVSSLFWSCKKDIDVKPTASQSGDSAGFLEIQVSNVVGNLPLVLNTGKYVTAVNDTFTVDLYKYYISNIKLVSATGHTYTALESYYLIDQSDPNSFRLLVKDVPVGEYSSMTFLMGVDHERNIAGAQTGSLDASHNMFWDWNTGYIMAKMEGYSPQSTEYYHKLVYHIGGHIGKFNALRPVTLNFSNNAMVSQKHTPRLNMNADLGMWFNAPNFTNFQTDNVVTGISLESSGIADNYSNMFSITSIIN